MTGPTIPEEQWPELEPGDEMLIKAGAGTPPQAHDRRAIVYHVSYTSALTLDGTRICWCQDGGRVHKTGNRDEDWRAHVSARAYGLLQAALCKVRAQAAWVN